MTPDDRPAVSAPGPGAGPLVIFDCDGVLVDSEALVADAESGLLAEAGVMLSPEQIADQFSGLSEPDMAAQVFRDWGVRLDEGFSRAKTDMVLELLSTRLQPVTGIAAVLAGLRERVCVASSSSPERVALSLRTAGLDRYFGGHIFSASMVSRGKPAPDLFLLAARAMGTVPGRCVVVEDSVYGVIGAVAAGMDVIGFTGASHCGAGARDRLVQAGAGQVAADAAQLGTLLRATLDRLWATAPMPDEGPGG